MKAKKILFLVAGILKTVAGGIGILIGLIVLLARNLIRDVFVASYDLIESVIKQVGSVEDQEKLLGFSKEEVVDYFLQMIVVIFVLILIVAIIWVIFGIINIRLGANNRWQSLTKGKSIALLICSWLLAFELITNTMTTIAIFIKSNKNKESLYTQATADKIIEVK